jgi:hypothetical protein
VVGQKALYDISLLTARLYAAQARTTLVDESQRDHAETALDWYDRCLAQVETLNKQGITYTWNTSPDSVLAERTLLGAMY